MADERPTVGELFAGIGGIGLGLERAGFRVAWHVEIDPFCRHVLEHRRPGVPTYGDIALVDWAAVEPVDLLAGGFPCQPVSIAGKQRAQADARWLWPEFARAIRDLRPRLVLVENVRNLLSANDGLAFAEVLGDLAALGFDAEWDCIPASAVGAPHQRDRLWLVASQGGVPDARGDDVRLERQRDGGEQGQPGPTEPEHDGGAGHLADADGGGPGDAPNADRERGLLPRWGQHAAVEVARRDGGEGRESIGDWWTAEPDVGRVANGVPARVDRLRALGNAVVPQVLEVIGPVLRERLR